jgi:hypothetical protein
MGLYAFDLKVNRPTNPYWSAETMTYQYKTGFIQISDGVEFIDQDWPYITNIVMYCGYDPRRKQFWYDDYEPKITLLFEEELVCDIHQAGGEQVHASYVGVYDNRLDGLVSRAICYRCYDSLYNSGCNLTDLRRVAS